MCQTLGKCFVEDSLTRQKDAVWEAGRFLEKHPEANYEELENHLRSKGSFILLAELRRILTEAINALAEQKRGPRRQERYNKILAVLPQ